MFPYYSPLGKRIMERGRLNREVFNYHLTLVTLSWALVALASVSHPVRAAMAKLSITMHLLGLVNETERLLPCVKPLGLVRDEICGRWLT